MQYLSTRNKGLGFDSASAIKKGLSVEGGLFVPEEIPALTLSDLQEMIKMTYIERAVFVLKRYLTDFSEEELNECAKGAYGGDKFQAESPAPLVILQKGIGVLELWHGPTCAFKDMALQILPHFLTKAMKKTGEDKTVVILVATSGDTGKAALEGFKDVDGTKIVVFYPSDGVSDIQKLQMITQKGNNVFVSGIRGNFDDAQTGVKIIFTDKEANKAFLENNCVMSSANSINWGRLVPQIVYYVSAYCDMVKSGEVELGKKINVCVPTGNFGNILAAYYAMKMGVPINRLICASNANNVLTEFIKSGKYDKNRKFHTTISPSMDILISSNLERLLFDLSDNDDKKISGWMKELSEKGFYEIDADVKENLTKVFWAGCCDDEATKDTIHKTKDEFDYTVDTHTAVAVNVYNQYRAETNDLTPTVIVSTASPFKFNQSVLSALGKDSEAMGLNDFELLDLLSVATGLSIPKSLADLKNAEKRFTGICAKDKLLDVVKEFIKA